MRGKPRNGQRKQEDGPRRPYTCQCVKCKRTVPVKGCSRLYTDAANSPKLCQFCEFERRTNPAKLLLE